MSEMRTHKDVQSKVQANKWFYSDEVKNHFFHPRNFLRTEKEVKKYEKECDGFGQVGSPACGDMMRMWLKIDKKKDKIIECKWQTFGCASAIGSTSALSVMLTKNGGMKIDKALKIKPQDIVKELGGLPNRKFHCSVLGDKALREALNDYFRKTSQNDRIQTGGAKIIDKVLKITDKDIEEAVLQGAQTLEDVQKKTKIGTQDKSCLTEVKELIKFYNEKYFG